MREPLTLEKLRAALDYDPASGVFTWRVTTSHAVAGATAGVFERFRGYRSIGVGGKTYRAHRLAWFYVHGEWPAQIDHINGDQTDNRIANLRPATLSQNNANSKRRRDNASGIKGVSFDTGRGKWKVQVSKDGKSIFLGRYPSREEAQKAYERGATKHHGEFARFDATGPP